MRNYEAPVAMAVNFEAVNILMTSTDTPEVLEVWGDEVANVDMKNIFE